MVFRPWFGFTDSDSDSYPCKSVVIALFDDQDMTIFSMHKLVFGHRLACSYTEIRLSDYALITIEETHWARHNNDQSLPIGIIR